MLVCLTALLLSPSRTVLVFAGFHLLLCLGTSRIYEQQRLESPAEMADLRGLETGVQNGAQGIAIPMAIAHAARRERYERILDPCSYSSLRAHVFEEQECPSRLEHAPDLAQPALWITHGTEDERDHRAVKMRIGERQGLDRGARERDGNGSSSQAAPGLDQHGLIRLDRLHPHDARGIVKGEVLPPTGTYLKHDSVCLPDDLTPQGIKPAPDERPIHQPVVKCGKTRGRDLLHTRGKARVVAHLILPSGVEEGRRSTTCTWKWFPGTGVGCSSMTSW